MAKASEATSASSVQLLRRFIDVHGVRGLATQGVLPEVLRATWMRIVQFFCYPLIHEALFEKSISQGSVPSKLTASILATVPSVLSITPLENAKIALQLDKEKRFNNSMREVIAFLRHRGALAPMMGWQGVQARQSVWLGTYLVTLGPFERQSCAVLQGALDEPQATAAGKLVAGFLAGSLGAVFNTPLDVMRTNLQKKGLLMAEKPMTLYETLCMTAGPRTYFSVGQEIVAARGFAGLYMGLGFKMLHLGGSGALLSCFIPMFKSLLNVNRELM